MKTKKILKLLFWERIEITTIALSFSKIFFI